MKNTITIILITIFNIALAIMSFIVPFKLIWSIIFCVGLILSLGFLSFAIFKRPKWKNLGLTFAILVQFVVVLFIIFYYTGVLSNFNSIENIRKYFEGFGIWAWAIFLAIQIAQVVILPIPGQITTIAGVIIFGPWITFVISSIAIMLGSTICFAMGRLIGSKLAYKLFDKELVEKYRNLLAKKGKVLLPIMFLFPIFPDDMLCFVAGMTKLSWTYFIITTFTTRLIGVACICWLGSGEIIPFRGWGIPVWIVLIILMAIAIYLLLKYQEQFEQLIIKIFSRKNKKDKKQLAKEKQEEVIQNTLDNQQIGHKDYVNFENHLNTKNDYVDFENLENSNGIQTNEYNDKSIKENNTNNTNDTKNSDN